MEDDYLEETQLMAETQNDASESMSEAGSGRGRKDVTTDRPDPFVEKFDGNRHAKETNKNNNRYFGRFTGFATSMFNR